MSPQSDSGINQDATAQTHLTGDRLLVLDDVKWKWGEIPETTPHASPSVHRHYKSSKMSQTPPVTVASTVVDHLTSTGAAAASLATEYRPSVSPSAVEQCTSEPGSMANSVELVVDSEGEKGLAESKPTSVVETDSIPSSHTTQPADSNNIVDSQVTEPLQETKKSGFLFLYFITLFWLDVTALVL